MKTKQVIVIRKDLGMRKGKMVAQGAHASLGAILSCKDNLFTDSVTIWTDDSIEDIYLKRDNPLRNWLDNSFTKICVSVDSEEELLEVYAKAVEANLIRCLITDNGDTEFGGIKTLTCCAIGPAYEDDLTPITGNLKLL